MCVWRDTPPQWDRYVPWRERGRVPGEVPYALGISVLTPEDTNAQGAGDLDWDPPPVPPLHVLVPLGGRYLHTHTHTPGTYISYNSPKIKTL